MSAEQEVASATAAMSTDGQASRGSHDAPKPSDPHALIIFGGSGDLAGRKLIPALYNLRQDGLLPDRFAVVGQGRRPMDDASYRTTLLEAASKFSRSGAPEPESWDDFAQSVHYLRGDSSDDEGFDRLTEELPRLEQAHGTGGNRIFYLATQPSLFPEIIRRLGASGLTECPGTCRIVIEKPFGRDLESAEALHAIANSVFDESQVYRIDHYLGKETVQNVLVFRFANSIFEPVWNRRYVSHVQITVAEEVGVEGRGRYYEEAGALRDIMQNHMMQLLAVVAMEPPVDFGADAIRDEKVKVLRALRRMTVADVRKHVVRASYSAGRLNGADVTAYRSEDGVAADSLTETYIAARWFIDSWRWQGVPFYMRTGKRLPKRATEIAIQFRSVPHRLFSDSSPDGVPPNRLVMRIQPNEGISITFEAKQPGPSVRVRPVRMDFGYGQGFAEESPDAYERLLLDVMLGDQTLFIRGDEAEAAWAAVMPVLSAWRFDEGHPLHFYQAGTWGPDAADDLLASDGFRWRRL
ncbi:MAG: glucose-6-phosphate dehydrogenase [Chloroflexota bacterium]|nr:glucose-6-phosphate dehydrogenase [Chloroflexota bacterium]